MTRSVTVTVEKFHLDCLALALVMFGNRLCLTQELEKGDILVNMKSYIDREEKKKA
jgi:hypothetical protein